jgi:hypothetical protein
VASTSTYRSKHDLRRRETAIRIDRHPIRIDEQLLPLPPAVGAGIERVTPETASTWLETMTLNRPVSDLHVTRLAAAMERGEWSITGEAIKFASNGKLLDGQHRLWAVVMSGVTIQTYVIRGLDEDARDRMDANLPRTATHNLAMHGFTYTNRLAGMISLLLSYEKYGHFDALSGSTRRPSKVEILAVAKARPELVDHLRLTSGKGLRLRGLSQSLLGALHAIFSEIDPADTEAFFTLLASGAGMEADNPIFQLRKRLADNAQASRKMALREVAALIIKAWNAYREGRSIRLLSFRAGGATPEAFPTPI